MKKLDKVPVRPKTVCIGCQSWGYEDWVTQPAGDTVFYPRGTKQSDMLPLYAHIFDTIEVDSTAYGVPPVSWLEGWYSKTPDNFTFSLKLPKEITHDRSLGPGSLPVLNEFAERVSILHEKLGMLLIQLPASFDGSKENAKSLRAFLAGLPAGFHFAIEFRNADWFIDWTFEELEKNRVSLALVEGPWLPRQTMFDAIAKVPSDLAYIRIMGEKDLEKFDRIYRERNAELELWAKAIESIAAGRVYVYVDNFFEGHAPATANKLKTRLGIKPADVSLLDAQGSLF